jgi:DNA-binding response OmpR family regulator
MILLVEDEAPLRRAFTHVLQGKGYQVIQAIDGNEALKLLDDCVFNLVITDIVLPNLNGIDLVNIIRTKWRRMPIILVSGYLSQEDGNRILEADTVFIQKPIKTEYLVQTVHRLIGDP